MRKLWRLLAIPLVLLAGHFGATRAAAHPLGNFTINRYTGLAFAPGTVSVEAIVDMAEIPTFQAISSIDVDGSGAVDEGESAAYSPAGCNALGHELDLRVAGQPVALSMVGSAVSFPAGAGGLPTMRLRCELHGDLPAIGEGSAVELVDHSFPDRLGWREIVVEATGLLIQGDVARTSSSAQLQRYPEDLLSTPLEQRQASFSLAPGASAADPAAGQMPLAPASRDDQLTALIGSAELGPSALLLALGLAFLWGAAHALAPGHGKTIVAAYLVGSRGTLRHAVFLGLTTTITHTAGVFGLGLITLFAASLVAPEQIFPWLSLVSGGLVAAIGLSMLRDRLRGAGIWPWSAPPAPPAHSHDHSHDHDHSHAYEHHHGGHTHSHMPPGAGGQPLSWRSLLMLGVSGGLLPCPSALVVLLGSIALGRVGLGLLLVLAFSLGLAGLLTAIGVTFVYAGRLLERVPHRPRWASLLPAASAALVALLGLGLTAQALLQLAG